MLETTAESVGHAEKANKLAFFRQSGWMMIATVGSGAMMFLVHSVSKKIDKPEYTVFTTMLQTLNMMTIPTVGLQNVFAQQVSRATTEAEKQQVVGTFRAVMQGVFWIWAAMAALVFLFQSPILKSFHIAHPAALWFTVAAGLMMLWQPILQGMLQGRQNFLWLGWVAVFNGLGRLAFGIIVVFQLHGGSTGLMGGALLGLTGLVLIAAWQNRDLWTSPRGPFPAREWLKCVVPLTLGCGVSQLLFGADMFFANKYHESDASAYGFGMTLARAIVLFTAPLVAVMFPKIVRSTALSQRSNLMTLTFFGTAILAIMAAITLPIIFEEVVKRGSNPDFVSVKNLMPLFAWSMVPLAVGNVLLNNLLARSQFAAVPWLVVVGVSYAVALTFRHDSLAQIVQTLGIFNVAFLAVCAFFTWGRRSPTP